MSNIYKLFLFPNCLFQNSWKGQTLFNQVCELISVSEKIYFGLRFVDATGQAVSETTEVETVNSVNRYVQVV